jgi:MFS family permease
MGVQGYLLYILTDYIHLGQTNPGLAVGTAMVTLSGVSTAAMLLSIGISGWIADKFGQLKPFVFGASLGTAVPMVILLVAPSWSAMLVAQLINGLSFGLYMAVDQALMTRVLPSKQDTARDLGILNIANAGPQVLAPFAASVIIASLGGYRWLFIVSLISVVIGALCVHPIRSVR